MSTLLAFQNELLTQAYDYMRFVQEKTQADNNYERIYSIAQVNSLTILIDQSPTTVELFNSVSRYIEVNLPRPFGERMRYTFGMRERPFDLHNNLKWLLQQEKYKHFILELIDSQAEMKRQHKEAQLQMQESFKLHPEVVVNQVIVDLKDENAKLIKKIKELEADLLQTQLERDYWREQFNRTKKENELVNLEKKQYQFDLLSAQERIKYLEQLNKKNSTKEEHGNSIPRAAPRQSGSR